MTGSRSLRLLRRLLRSAPLLVTCGALAWAFSTNPLAVPFTERAARDLALTLDRQVARRASADWIEAELAQAVAAGEAERAEMLLGLADDLGRNVDQSQAEALIAAQSGLLTGAIACGACMVDIRSCPSLAHIAACAAPFEMSPLGDLNALRRAGYAWATDAQIDTLDASLALVGLGATGALLVSGGSSAGIKAGAGLLRMARRMGSLTPGMARMLRLPVRLDALPAYLRGTGNLEDVTDVARLTRLSEVARDMDRVRKATSAPEALRLMRLVDTPEDAARLARVAEAAGPRTTRTVAVLGKSRAFRATVRLSRAAAGTLILLWLTLTQMAVVIGTRIGAVALRGLARAI